MAKLIQFLDRREAMKDIFLKLISLQRLENHLGIIALVTRASTPGGKIVAIGTALIVDQKLVNHIVLTKGITLEILVRSYTACWLLVLLDQLAAAIWSN